MMTGHDDHVDSPFEMSTWMCRERTSLVKLAGGFTRFYLKDMSKLAS